MIKKLQITSTVKDRIIDDQVDFLKVSFDLLDENDEVIESLSHGFEFGTDTAHIKRELQKFLEMRVGEEIAVIENKDQEELAKKADETIAALEQESQLEIPKELEVRREEVITVAREKEQAKVEVAESSEVKDAQSNDTTKN